MGALPNATIVGFTGTPVDNAARGKGTFSIFGLEDYCGYLLHKYSIKESIEDETTVPIRHLLTPSEMNVPGEYLPLRVLCACSGGRCDRRCRT